MFSEPSGLGTQTERSSYTFTIAIILCKGPLFTNVEKAHRGELLAAEARPMQEKH